MSEAPLAPPESRPDDDEDVAWALQTASTLWARGEAADAFVWLRRAADAATRAGHDYRASELGLHADAMEEAMREAVADPPTLDEIDVRMSIADRMSIEVEPDMLEEVTSDGPPLRIAPPPVPSGPPTRAPAPPPPPSVEARPTVGIPPPAPTSKSATGPSSGSPTALPPSASVAPPHSRRDTHRPRSVVPAAPLDLDLNPDDLSPVEVRRAPSMAPLAASAPHAASGPPSGSSGAVPTPASATGPLVGSPAGPAGSPASTALPTALPTPSPTPSSSTPSSSSVAAPRSPAEAPVTAPAIPPPPSPTPPVVAPRAPSVALDGPSSGRGAASARAPLSEAPASASPLSAFRSFAGVPSIPTPVRAKRKPRAPIFDPWADEVPQDSLPAAGAGVEGQAWDESAVFTSAAALDVLLRKRPPPPPPRRRTQTVDMSPSQRPPLPPAALGGAEGASEATPPPTSAGDAPPAPSMAPSAAASGGVSRPEAPLPAPSPSPPPADTVPRAAEPPPVPGPNEAPAGAAPPNEVPTPPLPRVVETPTETSPPAVVAPPTEAASPVAAPSLPPRPPEIASPVEPARVSSPPRAPEAAPEEASDRRSSPPGAPLPRPTSTPPRPGSTPPQPGSTPPQPQPPASVAPPRPATLPRPSLPPRPSTMPRAGTTPPPPLEARPEPLAAPRVPVIEPPPAAAVPEEPPPPPEADSTSSAPPSSMVLLGGLSLDRAESLSDLPPKVQRAVIAAAQVVDLASDEEVADFGVVLVLSGEIAVCAAVNDAPACRFVTGSLAPSRGSFEHGVSSRAVAFAGPARVARWDLDVLREALQSCPWVVDELEERGDRVQARVGATLGPLGDLDDLTRSSTLDGLTLRVLAPGETIVEKGAPGTGIMIIGGGSVEIADGGARETLGCGDPLFAAAALSGSPAPGSAKAGASGALLLMADRRGTQTLVTSLPTLLELLASG